MYEHEYEKQTSLPKLSFWGIWSYLMMGQLVKDTCSLIRNSILAFLTLPLWIFPGLIINGIMLKFKRSSEVTYMGYIFMNLIVLIFGCALRAKEIHTTGLFSLYMWGLILAGVAATGMAIIIGAASLCDKLFSGKTERQMHVIKTWINDVKKKHCTLINWK